MNTGWHRADFTVPLSSNNTTYLWPQELVDGFNLIFDFKWAQGGRGLFKFVESPLVRRERGVEQFGGIYEYVLLSFDPADTTDIPRRVLQLGLDNAPAPIEPHALSVIVHSGVFPDEDLHWIEFYDATRFARRRMVPAEFKIYTHNLSTLAEQIFNEEHDLAFKRCKVDDARWEQYSRIHNFSHYELISSSLLLASLFAPSRIPLATLLRLRLLMPTYEAAYACAAELPRDGSAGELPLNKLMLLYGQD